MQMSTMGGVVKLVCLIVLGFVCFVNGMASIHIGSVN